MNTYHPAWTLTFFVGTVVLLFLIFRPVTGWFWLLKKGKKVDSKVITEDILKQLFYAEEEQSEMRLNTMIGSLNLREKTLLPILEKMKSGELIQAKKGRYTLLPKGREYALKIIRVHRLYEKYLSEKTGFDKKEWHGKAEEMEHLMNDSQTEDLALKLGNPRYDPHGDPIPTTEGELAPVEGERLAELPVNTIGRIVHIEDKPEIIYRQILAEDIHIGSQIRVLESNNQRVRFFSEGEDYVLAPMVAENITVLIHDEEEIYEDAVRLSSLKPGEKAKVVSISRESRGEARRRLLDLGFVMGSDVRVDLTNPLGDPTAYLIKGATIALRKKQADKILIKKEL
ncbi:MAG TPA: DNA-binding protein [Saprospiraceae bacterium]|nr:DNA-binding protein [Saprospiraceae bacterium]